MKRVFSYFQTLTNAKLVLWCYLIWYAVTVSNHFSPDPRIWLNAIGISGVVGCGLMLSVSRSSGAKADPWQTFRLLLIPFCVSSFSALIKDKGFFLVFAPDPREVVSATAFCVAFVAWVALIKLARSR